MKFLKSIATTFLIAVAAANMTGCTRIGTGEVGIRTDMNNEIVLSEKLPGTWNQEFIGSILHAQTRDIYLVLDNQKPLTSDNTPMEDFDLTIVYSVNPASAAELYASKSKGFHEVEPDHSVHLMKNYMRTLAGNAMQKSVREYKALEVADKREILEKSIHDHVVQSLKDEKLDGSIVTGAVQVRSVVPNAQIQQSATAYVRSQNELKIKDNEVKIAEAESRRMAALSANSVQSIQYMQAQAALNISEGVKNGKVQTIVVPVDFKGIVATGK